MAHWCMEKKHAQFLATKKYLKNQDRMKNRLICGYQIFRQTHAFFYSAHLFVDGIY